MSKDYEILNTQQIQSRALKCAEENLDFVTMHPLTDASVFTTEVLPGIEVKTHFTVLPPPKKEK
jgi:hypothetical protein